MTSWVATIDARIRSSDPRGIPQHWAQRTGHPYPPVPIEDGLRFTFPVQAETPSQAEVTAESQLKDVFQHAEVLHVQVRLVTLWTYCIPYDDGAAPNPFWGVCTLAICKPVIRRNAQLGDWVVGVGSKNSPIGDVSTHVVYAMRVSAKVSMADYDVMTRTHLSNKVPVRKHKDWRRWVGDSIYDFTSDPPIQRAGVHLIDNRATDLGGQYVLRSDHFFYFGDHPKRLPDELLPIVKQGQGHRSVSNAPYVDVFTIWIEGLGVKANTLQGKPQIDLFKDEATPAACAAHDRKEDLEDERLAVSGLSDP